MAQMLLQRSQQKMTPGNASVLALAQRCINVWATETYVNCSDKRVIYRNKMTHTCNNQRYIMVQVAFSCQIT